MTKKMVLSVRNLVVDFETFAGDVKALDGVNFDINPGETLGLVGETGCGKSVTAHSILGLLPEAANIRSGEVWFEGENLLTRSDAEMQSIRGNRISMIFQEPMTALNPVFTVGDQITEVILLHQEAEVYKAAFKLPPEGLSGKLAQLPFIRSIANRDINFEAEKRAVEALKLVRMPDPHKVIDKYPHELSGGMKQRVMIAMALACRPTLLIADEPTTALDVTIQAQILHLMGGLKEQLGMSVLLITHDLGVVAEVCDRVAVMYAGTIVETGTVNAIFKEPQHPYTQGLLKTIPSVTDSKDRLDTIFGSVPNLLKPPTGCRFNPRCGNRFDLCLREKPRGVTMEDDHYVSCHHYDEPLLKHHGYGRSGR